MFRGRLSQVLALALSTACADEQVAPPVGSMSSSEPVRQFSDTFCGAVRQCCANAGFPAGPLADCATEVVRQMDFLSAIEAGTIRVGEPGFSNLTAFYGELAQTCMYPATFQSYQDDFAGAFEGTVALMGPCDKAAECVRGADPVACFRNGVPDSQPGICVPLTRGSLGDACLDTATAGYVGVTYSTSPALEPALVVCYTSDNLYCAVSSRTCEAQLAPNAACSGAEECQAGYTCDEVCRPAQQLGDACISRCPPPLTCSNGTCTPYPFADDDMCGGISTENGTSRCPPGLRELIPCGRARVAAPGFDSVPGGVRVVGDWAA